MAMRERLTIAALACASAAAFGLQAYVVMRPWLPW
jgi:hypothetical protein